MIIQHVPQIPSGLNMLRGMIQQKEPQHRISTCGKIANHSGFVIPCGTIGRSDRLRDNQTVETATLTV